MEQIWHLWIKALAVKTEGWMWLRTANEGAVDFCVKRLVYEGRVDINQDFSPIPWNCNSANGHINGKLT